MFVPRIALDGHAQGLGRENREGSTASTHSDVPGGISPRPDRTRSESRSTDVGYGGYEEGHDRGQARGRSVSPSGALFHDEEEQRQQGGGGMTAFARTAGALQNPSPEQGGHPMPKQQQPGVGPGFHGFQHRGSFRTGQRLEDLGYDLRTLGDNNPGLDITAATVSHDGSYVAYGDRKGYLYVTKNASGAKAGPLARRVGYCQVIDPLNSLEVRPKVNSIKFLNTGGATPYMVTCNDNVPKMWKVIQSRHAPPPFSAIDNLLQSSKTVPSLTTVKKDVGDLVLVKEAARFAIDHEHNIKDVCTFPLDPSRIVTMDDLQLRTWDVDHPRTSLELYSMKPPPGEELRESFCTASVHEAQSHVVFATSTNGCVRLFDTREALTWHGSRPKMFTNPDRAEDGEYSAVTCHLSSVAISPNGYHMVGRDVMSLVMWDLRKSSSTSREGGSAGGLPVCRWPLHPELGAHFENLYNTELLFERFSVTYSQSKGHMVHTGSMDGSIISLDPSRSSAATSTPTTVGADGAPGSAVPTGDTSLMWKTATGIDQKNENGALCPTPYDPLRPSGAASNTTGEDADYSKRITTLAVGGYGPNEVLVASNRSTLHVASI